MIFLSDLLCLLQIFIHFSHNLVLIKLFHILLPSVNTLEQPDFICLLCCGYQFCRVLQYHLHKLFCHRSWVLHAGWHVNLNQPRVQVFINHEIIPNKFTISLSSICEPFATLYRPHNNVLNLFNDFVPCLFANKGNELTLFPHTFVNDQILIVLLDGVVSQVLEPIVNVVKGVIISTEPDVTFVIKPDFGWIVILYMDPLPDIELFTTN